VPVGGEVADGLVGADPVEQHTAAATFPPGVPAYVDLAEVRSNSPHEATLLTTPMPKEGYILAGGAEYTLDIAVAAENMSSQRWRVTLTHTGSWNGDPTRLYEALDVRTESMSQSSRGRHD
jgi:hypothetical protein